MSYTEPGITRLDLFSDGLYCDILVTDGEVVYKITDNFESSKSHFDKIFNDTVYILEIDTKTEDMTVHTVRNDNFRGINETRKMKGKGKVHTPVVKEVLRFERKSIGGSYWVQITEEIVNDVDKQRLVVDKVKVLFKKKKVVGSESIKTEFEEWVQTL